MFLYEYFYQHYGIRRTSQLISPPMPLVEQLHLPKRSLFHFMGTSPLDQGPDSNQLEFRGVTKPIVVQHVFEQRAQLGHPRPIPTSTQLLSSKWFQRNRRYKKLLNFDVGTRDENTLAVFNYAFLWGLFRYPRSLYTAYSQWHNIAETMWSVAGEIAQTSNRHQFIPITLPRILPCLADLNLGTASGMNQRLIKRFNSHESLMILEIWKWLGENRKTSMLSHVDDKRLSRINLLFEESGRWFVMNLGTVNDWRVATEAELAADPDANQHGLAPQRLQRYFLKMLMSLMEARTTAAPEVMAQSDSESAPSDLTPDEPSNVVDVIDPLTGVAVKQVSQPFEVPNGLGVTPKQVDADINEELDQNRQAAAKVAHVIQHQAIEPAERGIDIKPDLEVEKQMDHDLDQLEYIANISHADEDDASMQRPLESPGTLTPDGAVMKICDRLAEQGMLTAGEHRRYQALSEAYKKIVAPDGKSTLADFVKIPAEAIAIPASPEIPDIKTVTDKSMLKSSLHVFDSHYIKHVMQKDIAGMVLNLQQAGLCVTDYDVQEVDDVMGTYNVYTARVTPVDGASSTFRFRLPVLSEDGTFTSNGVKYRVRKQRGDLPIRKIAPDRVALTSYYGKVFVSRSTKRVNDSGTWLVNNITAIGLDKSNPIVQHLQTAAVFDNLFTAPRLYSTLAMAFRGFQLGGFDWSFDHTKREALYGKDTLAMIERDGIVVCGKSLRKPNAFLIMDRQGALYQYDKGERHRPLDLPSIEEMLGLDPSKSPVDFAEVSVLGRTIPLGIVLAYEMGLDRLMKFLGVEPRRVPAGQRVNLQPNEYSLVFADETLVLPKDKMYASLVLAGFNEYHRSIRTYNLHEFNKRGVYLNVLESGGASQRYLRELDLQYQLFVDPITRELLIDMKEPTDYQSLLLKACEMLLTDTHPDELDSRWMRIKGYERMSGAVYSEIVRSIRVHNGRPGKSRVPIDLNPFQVWKNVTQDPAKIQVSDINPIQNLKEMEAVTYSGVGGRGSRSMTKQTRVYHENDMGTISESTVDSSDVAINTYTSADPQFTSLRGLSRRYDLKTSGVTALLSTSALLSPAADRDD
ncbi:hypothetical protein [Paraburkholderia sp. BCC1886]|uniref:hypothetical protein n=1 Tax=Paraburkholderia sp. BCC1886 TaxID=2562670 RepID=UPI001183A2AE|nr:hypothetical protein [Paraburkholderia sp. BCC1886]